MVEYKDMINMIKNKIGEDVYNLNKDFLYFKNGSIYYINKDINYEVANCHYGYITSGIDEILIKKR